MYNFGCLPPKVDVRDYKLAKNEAVIADLPREFNLITQVPKVKNQGGVSSCVAHAMSSVLESHADPNTTLSTNFLYGMQNMACGHDGKGMYLSDACKIAKEYGDMLEKDCRGNTEVPECWTIAEAAVSDEAKAERAKKYKIECYFSCKDTNDVKVALKKYGCVLASVRWYHNFRPDENGVITGSRTGKYGYHGIMIYGWNKTGFLCQNSWGEGWGNKGRFILPYEIPLAEAKGIVDATDDGTIIRPKRNKFLDFLYKIINALLNLFKKKK